MSRRRPPARRRPARKRPPRRRPARRRSDADLLLVLVAVVAAATLVVAVVNWLLAHWWVLLLAGVVAAAGGGAWLHQQAQRAQWEQVRARGLRYAVGQLDGLHHREFEHAIRDLMHRDGCQNAQRVGGGGDLGADVKATDPYGRRWVVQCKHRRHGDRGAPVGTPDLQVLNGTARQVHGADVAVIVTNGRVTAPARVFAKEQRLHVVDRRTLAVWASGSQPLWELLQAVPPPRKPPALS